MDTVIVVHPLGDYYSEIELGKVEFTELRMWSELTTEERARMLTTQAPADFMLTEARFIQEAGVPEGWAECLEGDFIPGELEPLGMAKLSLTSAEGDTNYSAYSNPVFRRVGR